MNKIIILLLCFINVIYANHIRRFLSNDPVIKYCVNEYDCGLNGNCKQINSTSSICACNTGYITADINSVCNYQQITKLEAFLVSFFVGCLGVDWFILARGNSLYIGLGVLKFLTCGGCGIWWICDWIRIICSSFYDGNGQPLANW